MSTNENTTPWIAVEPKLFGRAIFFVSSRARQAKRLAEDSIWSVQRMQRAGGTFPYLLGESRSSLYSGNHSERLFEDGKVVNLRIAAARLNDLFFPTGALFSFWRQIGYPGSTAGFTKGREIRFGCVVPSIAGGLCQITGALFECAKLAGAEIVERHRHSRRLPGVPYSPARDATVFWNYVDFRFRARQEMRLQVTVNDSELIVRLYGKAPRSFVNESYAETPAPFASDCLNCGKITCSFHSETHFESAWTLQRSLEMEAWLSRQKNISLRFPPLAVRVCGAILRRALMPIWPLARVNFFVNSLLARFIHVPDGALLHQSLALPLFMLGKLHGKTFSLWLDYLPLRETQRRLDTCVWKGSAQDFRVSSELERKEVAMLAAATDIYTSHALIRALVSRAQLVEENIVPQKATALAEPLGILFPAPAIDREGIREARGAAQALGLKLYSSKDDIPWENILALVHPTVFESRRSLHREARARGIPLVISDGVGMDGVIAPLWDVQAITEELRKLLIKRRSNYVVD